MNCTRNNTGNRNNQNVLELYGVFRDYIVHEDSLINNRLTWLLTIQGLLFAAYGLSVKEAIKNSALNSLICLLKILGIGTSFFSFLGILAAILAITEVEKKWNLLQETDPYKNASLIEQKHLPDITSGRSTTANILGVLAPLAIPFIFFVSWFTLLDF